MHKLMISAAAVAGAGLWAVTALSEAQAPATVQGTRYIESPLEGDATKIVRLTTVAIQPGGGNNFHRHPGDQWQVVQEGEVTFTIKGQPPRKLKVGDSVHILRGTIHRNQNMTDKPSRSVELVIVDKDKPQTEQVAD
jgi:quercetin dioxygenase-like cupin family protein